jgi:amidohydrolase
MNTVDIIDKLSTIIEANRTDIISLGEEIYKNPETGFREFETSRLISEKFKQLGLKYETFSSIPGVKATIDTGRPGPGIAIFGELDSVICREHPHCNKENGAVHACGHNAQLAAMVGAAVCVINSGISDLLSGKIHFIAVPAEEYIEVEYRKELRDKGVINYLGGKPEILYRGWLDDVDICMMIHVNSSQNKITLETTSNGCLVKKVKYIGNASHAGIAPDEGINALYAAEIGMMAINSVRETFREDDYIRVHPIITKGGDVVNVIPADVRIETFVRGKTMEAILDADKKVNRALVGGAVSVGAKVEIENIPGYFPLATDKKLSELAGKLAFELTGERNIPVAGHGTGSTDLGDVSTLMPVIEIGIGGIKGGLHSCDYRNVDHETSYILSSKILASMVVELLGENASKAHDVINGYKPKFKTKQDYFKFADTLFSKKLLPEIDYFK